MASEASKELLKLFTEIENGAVEAGAISFAEAVEGALPAVLARHEQMVRAKVAEEIEAQKISARGDWGAGWNKAITTLAADIRAGES